MSETKKERFDKEIKKLLREPKENFGYKIDDKTYECYYASSVFDEFVKGMGDAQRQYSEGDGGELNEKNGRYGLMPPKMASVASSSRFIYLTFKENTNSKMQLFAKGIESDGRFRLEEKLEIHIVSSTPNLDAIYRTKSHTLYFEAKCHELFDSHALVWKNAYFANGVFYGEQNTSLQLKNTKALKVYKKGKIDSERKALERSVFGIEDDGPLKFDFKQCVCHLLGIANDDAPNKELIYLYFRPAELNMFEKDYEIMERQLKSFCKSEVISSFLERNNIKIRLFYAINRTMKDELIVNEIGLRG